MKTLLLTTEVLGFAASPVVADECPAKMLAAESDALHKAGKHAESVAKSPIHETPRGPAGSRGVVFWGSR